MYFGTEKQLPILTAHYIGGLSHSTGWIKAQLILVAIALIMYDDNNDDDGDVVFDVK